MQPRLLSIEDAEALKIDEVWDLYKSHISGSQVKLIGSFGFGRETVTRAEGCYIYTGSGRKVLDLTGGIGVLNHGHNHPRVLDARRRFANAKRMEVHKNFFSPYVAVLARNIATLLPEDLNISYFPNSGAEAVEGAVKLAYKFHGGRRSKILHSDISFHGKLLGAAGLTASPELHFEYPTIPGTSTFGYDDIQSFRRVLEAHRQPDGSSDVYAVIVEPLNASSMRSCSEDFLFEIRRLCTLNDIVLIFDEVYTGWGKTGHLFNFMRCASLVPDVVTYAKSFGGGKASISGYTCRDHLYRQAYDNLRDATLHSTTYYGFGEETATAIEAVNTIIEENLVERASWIGTRFSESLNSQFKDSDERFFELRGSGALWGLVLRQTKLSWAIEQLSRALPGEFFRDPRVARKVVLGSVINYLYEEEDILTYYGSNIDNPLIVSFPLVAGEREVDHAVEALGRCFSKSQIGKLGSFVRSRLAGP